MAGGSGSSAAPQVAGLLLQIARALHHLSAADADEAVGVEVVDDVSRHRGAEVLIKEQDKHTVEPGTGLLGDRSKDLWRTLQIWIDAYRAEGRFCGRYFLVTNAAAAGNFVKALKESANNPSRLREAVAALRTVGERRRPPRPPGGRQRLQAIIDDVLIESDSVLVSLAERIEVVESYDAEAAKTALVNGFAIDPGVDAGLVLDALLGWFVDVLRRAWVAKQPAIVTRDACVRQCRIIERAQLRRRLMPRPASDLPVQAAEVAKARGRPFVDHLGRIQADDDDVLQAIQHFIQFNIEKDRLARSGEIPFREWRDRGARLKLRWRNEAKHVAVEHAHRTRVDRGRLILARTTYAHCETLSGQPCEELYMTSGHYHRLADDDTVWWDPEYQGRQDA